MKLLSLGQVGTKGKKVGAEGKVVCKVGIYNCSQPSNVSLLHVTLSKVLIFYKFMQPLNNPEPIDFILFVSSYNS